MLDINTIVYKLPIEVDSTKLLNELDSLVLPYHERDIRNNLGTGKAAGIAITNRADTPHRGWYNSEYNRPTHNTIHVPTKTNLQKDFGRYTLGFPGPWKDDVHAFYSNGTADRDLVHWHPDLANSEMYNLTIRIAECLKINNRLRCRASFMQGPTGLSTHSDPHTPWRVHINLKSGPGTYWKFSDIDTKETVEWVQPKDSVWLVRTGNVQHGLVIPEGETRWQLFYHIWQADLGPNYHQIA